MINFHTCCLQQWESIFIRALYFVFQNVWIRLTFSLYIHPRFVAYFIFKVMHKILMVLKISFVDLIIAVGCFIYAIDCVIKKDPIFSLLAKNGTYASIYAFFFFTLLTNLLLKYPTFQDLTISSCLSA